MFWAYRYKPSIKIILSTFAIAIFFLIALQTVKGIYRNQVWSGYSGNKVELFYTLIVNTYFSDEGNDAYGVSGVDNVVRLNQGWIISSIMDNVPESQDFFNGQTIIEAIRSSIVPRFLDPDKTQAGGRENFRKFTGLPINEGTSMGISIIGEGYGNFGVLGGIIFMGFWGLFITWIWNRIMKKSFQNILFVAFIPLIFLQVVKAETELVVVLNHLIKTLIFVLIFLMATRKIWSLKIIYVDEPVLSDAAQ
jgi:hypothetical protein